MSRSATAPRAQPSAAAPVPRWVAITVIVAAIVTAASITASALLPGGNLALGLIAAGALVALVLAGAPLVIAAGRRRRVPVSVVLALVLVLGVLAVAASGQPLRAGAQSAAPTLATAAADGSCPTEAGIYRVIACQAVPNGTLFFVEGAGISTVGGLAVLDQPPSTLRVTTQSGTTLSVRHVTGTIFEVSSLFMDP